MSLTPEQKALLRECSKDEAAYHQLIAAFETHEEHAAPLSELRMLRSALDAVPDRIYVKDRDSRFVLANRATWMAHKMPDEQSLLGKTDLDLFGELGRAYFEAEQYMLQTNGSIINRVHGIHHHIPSHERSYLLISKVPLHDQNGHVIGLIGINRDITELKRVEEELRQNQAFSVQVTLAIPDIIYVTDLDQQATIYCNDQVIPLLGYTPEQVYEMGSAFLPTLLHPEDWLRRSDLVRRYTQARDGDILEFEYRLQHLDGTWRWLLSREMVFKRKPDGAPAQILGIANDITERKRAEEAQRRSEAQKNALINAMPDLIIELDDEGKILNLKPRGGSIPTFPPHECIGHGLNKIYPPDTAAQLLALVKRARATGQTQKCEYQSPFASENTIREARVVAIDPTRVMIISRDISEHKVIEQALLEQERLQTTLQKEQELYLLKSRMMTRISHEFRTPLSVIMASNELLWHYNRRMTPEQRQDHFLRIQEEIQNMSEILKSISFIVQTRAQQRALEMHACDLRQMCREIVQQLQSREETRRQWDIFEEGDLRLLPADESLIHRMIHHLFLNAVRYSPAQSPICLELCRHGKEIVLRLNDQGLGIPPSDQPRLYEPFFRGSNVGEISGMGLGLALVKHAVDLHDGRISIDSAVGSGTTVTVHLPTTV